MSVLGPSMDLDDTHTLPQMRFCLTAVSQPLETRGGGGMELVIKLVQGLPYTLH